MAKWKICAISLLFLLGWNILSMESLTLTSAGSMDGKWKFEEGDAIALKCTIPSYSGYLKWKLNGTDVATCTPQICKTLTTGTGSFSFSFDTSNFIFEWGINPVSMSYNKAVFECFHNSTDNANFTAEVQRQNTTGTTTTQTPISSVELKASLTIACLALFICIILLIVSITIYKRLANKIKRNKVNETPLEALKERK